MEESNQVEESNNDIDIKEKEPEVTPSKEAKKSKSKGSQHKTALDKLKAKVEELETERNNLKDLLLRKAAEFDNYKKRTDSDFAQRIAIENAKLITQLLPIMDDFERCLTSYRENEDLSGLRDGVDLIFKNFSKVFEDNGIEAIAAVGSDFDPEKHEALMQVDSEDYESGVVVDEHLKGYIMNNRVLRHAQVLVSK